MNIEDDAFLKDLTEKLEQFQKNNPELIELKKHYNQLPAEERKEIEDPEVQRIALDILKTFFKK